jgi:hypothetical protein
MRRLQLRRVVVVIGAIVSVVAGSSFGASALAGGSDRARAKTVVACANSSLTQVRFKTKPKHCIFVKRGQSAGVYAAPTKSMKWKHWTHPHTRGKGKGLLNMLGKTPVKVVLSKPVTKCGHRVYSKVKIRYPEQDLGGDYKLDTCK